MSIRILFPSKLAQNGQLPPDNPILRMNRRRQKGPAIETGPFRAFCAPDLEVQGNHGLVARALANLIDNALKYGAGGEIRLEAAATNAEVHMSVADRAKGIPASRHAEAIRKFGRLDPAPSTPGSGLGLSLVTAVASLHRGKLTLP